MTSDTNCTPVTPAIPVTSDTPVTPAALVRDTPTTPAAPANISGVPRGVDILISYLYRFSVRPRPGNASVVHWISVW